jgi:hydroxymethylbilane synthase
VISAPLSPEAMLPAAAQGAIGIEVRADDVAVLELLAAIDHRATSIRVAAERAFLAALEGSCRTPIAALAELEGQEVRLRGLVARPDGSDLRRIERRGAVSDAVALGGDTGAELLAGLPAGFLAA